MHLADCVEGNYRIYAGALELGDRYVAAVVAVRTKGVPDAPREALRDTGMAGGQCWRQADQAVAFAVKEARALIR